MKSKSCQALRAVIGNLNARDFFERTIRLSGVPYQLRSIPIDLVQESSIGRQPIVARAAGDGGVETPGGAISWNLWARRILRDFESFAVNAVAGEIAVTEVRREHEVVIRRDSGPAQLRWQPRPSVNLHDRADGNLAVSINGCQGASVANRISDDEGIRPAMQKSEIERRCPFSVLELGGAKRAIITHWEYDDAVGIW